MNNSFLKEGGGFIIAFLLGSVSLHGMLFYLITDANDLFLSDGDSLFPLVAFISVYAGLPIAAVSIWRYVFKHDKLKKKINLNNDVLAAFKRFERIAISLLVLSWISFTTYIVLWLSKPEMIVAGIEWLYILSTLLIIISASFFMMAVFKIKQLEPGEGDDPLKTKQDEQAEINERKFGVEFNLILFGWLVLAVWIITLFSNHVQLSPDLKIGYVEDHQPVSNLKSKLSTIKHNLGVYNSSLDLITDIHHEVISSSEQRPRPDSAAISIKDIDSTIDSWYQTSDTDTNSFDEAEKEPYREIIAQLNENFVGKKKLQETDIWIKNTENKLFLLRDRAEQELINDLLPVLIKSQNYFQLVFILLILMGIMYWRIAMTAYQAKMILAKKDEEVEEPKELEFTKGYIIFVFVLIVPILKPIENQNIEFHKPLWTVNAASFKPTKPYDPTPSEKEDAQVQIIFNEGDSLSNSDYKDLKAEVESLRVLISSYNPNSSTVDLKEIEEQLDRIESELKKSKKR